MKWITRAHINIDRAASSWLIKRFVDSEAEFIFVSKNSVNDEAKRIDAVPFDTPGVELGHRGDKCTFATIIEKHGIGDPAISMLSEAVNAAETGLAEKNPYAPGLEAIARGFSLMYPDDHENLEHQLLVYDSLYVYFRLKAAGTR
jgi:hypothetical protein